MQSSCPPSINEIQPIPSCSVLAHGLLKQWPALLLRFCSPHRVSEAEKRLLSVCRLENIRLLVEKMDSPVGRVYRARYGVGGLVECQHAIPLVPSTPLMASNIGQSSRLVDRPSHQSWGYDRSFVRCMLFTGTTMFWRLVPCTQAETLRLNSVVRDMQQR